MSGSGGSAMAGGGAGGAAGLGGASGASGSGGSGGSGATGARQPSCASLAATCGPNGSGDCCAASAVPGGTFYRLNDSNYPATVSPFRLDDYEVTVGRFRKFVAGFPGNKPPAGSGKNPNNASDPGWDASWNTSNLPADALALTTSLKCHDGQQTWTDAENAGNENRPINCATWYLAFSFCIWDGGRLPTEAEWNFAASGGNEHRQFPWSNPPSSTAIDDTHTSYFSGDCLGDGLPGCSVLDIVPAGSKPAGRARWGQTEMAGNLWEWVLDWSQNLANPCNDCAQFSATVQRVLRGGGFYDYGDPMYLRNSYRGYSFPYDRFRYIGFRCARAP
jgi:formylglycine-generating enzyme required for sulfatase activity